MGRVLLADDDQLVRLGLRMALERFGHTVVEAGDGGSFMTELAETRFDLCIMDLAMPGPPLAERLSAARAKSVPVLVLTGYEPPTQSQPSDVLAYATKPIQLRELHSALERLGLQRGR